MATSLRAAMIWTLLLLALSMVVGVTLAILFTKSSITIEADTESLRINRFCGADTVAILLPAGNVTAFADNLPGVPSPKPYEATVYHVKGAHQLSIHRRPEGPLMVDLASLEDGNDSDWYIESCEPDCAELAGEERHFRQVSFTSDSSTKEKPLRLDRVSIPITGAVVLGEPLSVGQDPDGQPIAHFPLRSGAIRLRSEAWLPGRSRVDLAEYRLDLGDIVRTRRTEERPVNACVETQAEGFVRPTNREDGALEAVVRINTDTVNISRGQQVRVRANAFQKFAAQPIVTAAWTSVIAIFAILGSMFTLFELVRAHRRRS